MERNPPEAVVDYLESLEEDEAVDEVRLEFIGQAWVDEYARAVDDGHTEFTIPLEDLKTRDNEWAIHSTATSYHVEDSLHRHENAPEWVQDWDGPFELKLANH